MTEILDEGLEPDEPSDDLPLEHYERLKIEAARKGLEEFARVSGELVLQVNKRDKQDLDRAHQADLGRGDQPDAGNEHKDH